MKSAAERIYANIINLPHHQSYGRKHMSLHDRAAQFAPFAALSGYDLMIQEEGRLTYSQKELSEYQSEILDRRMNLISDMSDSGKAPIVTIIFFCPDKRKAGGSYETITAMVKSIDTVSKSIFLYGSENKDDRRVPPVRIDFQAIADIIITGQDDMYDL